MGRLHTLFCAECTASFDYKAIGAYWSHNASGMAGGITRLLACDEEQLMVYRGLKLGPTFVHTNHARIKYTHPSGAARPPGARDADTSPTYNKAASIMHWALESPEAALVDYVLYIDADMLLRKPIDPVHLGARRGVVVSEHVAYLDKGVRSGLLQQFLSPEAVKVASAEMESPPLNMLHVLSAVPEGDSPWPARDPRRGKRHAAGGWIHIFHVDDLRKIAPRWLHWCREMRLNPQRYWSLRDPATGTLSIANDIDTGDSYANRGESPWISEMYGYMMAAAEAGVRHVLTRGLVVYPDKIGAEFESAASIIHYGLACSVGTFTFDKKFWERFDVFACSGDTLSTPQRTSIAHEHLCVETANSLNEALCDYYAKSIAEGGCGFAQSGRQSAACANLYRAGEGGASQLQVIICASESGSCACKGEVRYGYGHAWSDWRPVHGMVECSNAVFGDVFPGQTKRCECAVKGATTPPAASPPTPAVATELPTPFERRAQGVVTTASGKGRASSSEGVLAEGVIGHGSGEPAARRPRLELHDGVDRGWLQQGRALLLVLAIGMLLLAARYALGTRTRRWIQLTSSSTRKERAEAEHPEEDEESPPPAWQSDRGSRGSLTARPMRTRHAQKKMRDERDR